MGSTVYRVVSHVQLFHRAVLASGMYHVSSAGIVLLVGSLHVRRHCVNSGKKTADQ